MMIPNSEAVEAPPRAVAKLRGVAGAAPECLLLARARPPLLVR